MTRLTHWRSVLVVGVPPTFAVLTLAHPVEDPWALGAATDRWLFVHTGQLVLTVLLAYAVWELVAGVGSRSANLVRGMLPVFLVAFSAFDAVAGLATGWLARDARGRSGQSAEGIRDSVEHLFSDNWLAGNLSVLGGVTAVSWATIAIALALALRGAGADRLTVAALFGAVLFASHPAPFGTFGLLSLAVAGWRWQRAAGTPGGSDSVRRRRVPRSSAPTDAAIRTDPIDAWFIDHPLRGLA